MAKAKKHDERKRKIGERLEHHERELTSQELTDQHEQLIALLGDKATMEEERKAKTAEIAAQIKRAQQQISATLETLRRKRVREEILVEEWLTPRNEVIRINAVTGEQIGARTAHPSELQEELPLAEHEPSQDGGMHGGSYVSPDDAAPDNVIAADFGDDGNSDEIH